MFFDYLGPNTFHQNKTVIVEPRRAHRDVQEIEHDVHPPTFHDKIEGHVDHGRDKPFCIRVFRYEIAHGDHTSGGR